MTWFRVDDGFADHPKVIALQSGKNWKGALALWTLAGAWSSKHLTDGHVPSVVVSRLGGSSAEAAALVAAGLWDHAEGGYRFHDWLDRNPSRARVEEKRDGQRQRVSRHREKRARDAPCNALQDEHVSQQVTPPPSRPVPTRERRAPIPVDSEYAPSLVALGDRIRAGTAEGLAAIGEPIPDECRELTWPGWAKVARWAREKAEHLRRDEADVAAQAVRSFLSSRRAKARGYPPSFLAKNPSEFWSEVA